MTEIAYSNLGSGSIPYTSSIRAGEDLGGGQTAQGYRRGVNVLIMNPEDSVTSPFFRSSGIVLAANQIFDLSGSGLIPYRKSITIKNLGGAPLLIYNNINIIDEYSYPLYANQEKEFAIMDNCRLYIKASGAPADVRWFEI